MFRYIPTNVYKKKITRRALRRIFSPLQEDGRFQSLYNDEIYDQYHDPTIMDKIRQNSLRWADHLIRVDEDGLTTALLFLI